MLKINESVLCTRCGKVVDTTPTFSTELCVKCLRKFWKFGR